MMHQWPTQAGAFSTPENGLSWQPWTGAGIGTGAIEPAGFPSGSRVTEEGDVRVTEEGDVRVIE